MYLGTAIFLIFIICVAAVSLTTEIGRLFVELASELSGFGSISSFLAQNSLR